jgi:hypothetical protein
MAGHNGPTEQAGKDHGRKPTKKDDLLHDFRVMDRQAARFNVGKTM